MDRIFPLIDTLLKSKEHVFIAIDGQCASGKSCFADKLKGIYDANVFRMDDFFLPPERRTAARMSEAGGNVDYERFTEEVIGPLERREIFTYRIFNCQTGNYIESAPVTPRRLNIAEGAYSMHPRFRNVYNLKVAFTVNPAAQRERLNKRNGLEESYVFAEKWIPLENDYLTKTNVLNECDLVIDTSDLW